jgi:hypothetical protein
VSRLVGLCLKLTLRSFGVLRTPQDDMLVLWRTKRTAGGSAASGQDVSRKKVSARDFVAAPTSELMV